MLSIALRLLIFLVIIYLGLAAIIYFQQSKFIFPSPQQAHAPAPGYEAVILETADGLQLTAHWRTSDEGRPTIVHFHGNAGSLQGSTVENAIFVSEGYGALLVEYRGYVGNPGSPSEIGLKEDGRAAMVFLKEKDIERARTIIKGHSIGTGTAINMALEHKAGALILVAPFTSVPDLIGSMMPLLPVRFLIRSGFDNEAKAKRLDLPVLVQHGTDDQVIPEAHGRDVSAAIAGSAFHSVPGARHDLTFDPSVQAKQLAWLASQGL